MTCNSCNDHYQQLIMSGQQDRISIEELAENCPACEARPRFKTFRIVYEQQVIPRLGNIREEVTALLISPAHWEVDLIAPRMEKIIFSALYGNYGPKTVKSDLRDLAEFSDGQFDFLHACNVLDYILEIDQVLASAARVLKRRGLFLFHIAEDRLTSGDIPPFVHGSKHEPYYPDGLSLPSVYFGKQDLLKRLKANHFQAEMYEVLDLFSGNYCTWFLGTKVK